VRYRLMKARRVVEDACVAAEEGAKSPALPAYARQRLVKGGSLPTVAVKAVGPGAVGEREAALVEYVVFAMNDALWGELWGML
jgi:hypothetical protein